MEKTPLQKAKRAYHDKCRRITVYYRYDVDEDIEVLEKLKVRVNGNDSKLPGLVKKIIAADTKNMSMSTTPFSFDLLDIPLCSVRFSIDFEFAWQWLGYSLKHEAFEQFVKLGFVKNLDYEVNSTNRLCISIECLACWAYAAEIKQAQEILSFLGYSEAWNKELNL